MLRRRIQKRVKKIVAMANGTALLVLVVVVAIVKELMLSASTPIPILNMIVVVQDLINY